MEHPYMQWNRLDCFSPISQPPAHWPHLLGLCRTASPSRYALYRNPSVLAVRKSQPPVSASSRLASPSRLATSPPPAAWPPPAASVRSSSIAPVRLQPPRRLQPRLPVRPWFVRPARSRAARAAPRWPGRRPALRAPSSPASLSSAPPSAAALCTSGRRTRPGTARHGCRCLAGIASNLCKISERSCLFLHQRSTKVILWEKVLQPEIKYR